MAISGFSELFVTFGQQIGILAIVATGLSALQKRPGAVSRQTVQLTAGLLFGAAAVLAMQEPVRLVPGVMFDARNVVLGVSGLFGGPIAAAIAAALAGAYRAWLGGNGAAPALVAMAGIALASAGIGAWARRGGAPVRLRHVALLAVVATAVSLGSFLLLPAGVVWPALRAVALPLAAANLLGISVLAFILMEAERRRALQDELTVALEDYERQARQLRASEAKYRLLANNTGDLILKLDTSLRCLYASPSSYDILGYTSEELLERSSMALVHPDDVEALEDRLVSLLAGHREAERNIHRLLHRDGHTLWVEAHYRLARKGQGRPVEIISVVRDISDRMKLEEQFRHAQALQALGQLTGGIAHDFNNLLTVIVGNAEFLLERAKEDQDRKLTEEILSSTERAADLVAKLLSFGRRQALQPKLIDVSELALEMAGLLRRVVGSGIEVTVEAEPEAKTRADAAFLQGAVLNLAINARDAMPEGGALNIRSGRRLAGSEDGDIPPGSSIVFLSVEDNGMGIPPEVLSRVFEPFFTTKGVGKGSGLGLSMVYGFAKQSGGHVAIRSEVGRGTCVTILLLAAVDAPAPPRPDDNEAGPPQLGSSGSGEMPGEGDTDGNETTARIWSRRMGGASMSIAAETLASEATGPASRATRRAA
jgi:PAS domain S-box-containing protein